MNQVSEATVVALHSDHSSRARGAADEDLFRPFRYLDTLPAEPDWLWRGFLAPGQVTMLTGHAFVGKSLLVAGMLKAIEEGSPFLGRPTTSATALLLSEEDESVMRGRAEKLGLLQLQSEFVSRNSGALRLPWPDLIQRATERALAKGHKLLIIDTFAGLAGLASEEENHAGAVMERMHPLVDAAGQGLAVLFLHHMNDKGQARGSKAFRAAVDVMVRLYRHGKRKQVRLEADGRYPGATPARLDGVLEVGAREWVFLPLKQVTANGDSVPRPRTTDQLLRQALEQAGPAGLSYADFNDIAGLSRDIAAKRLPDWYPGRVDRTGAGTKTDPYRWFLRTGRSDAVR